MRRVMSLSSVVIGSISELVLGMVLFIFLVSNELVFGES